ncbi:MFS transporter [Amycolatopsis echigonensis]
MAGFFGGMLEYYDMSIYASASSLVFARIFFPDAGASALLLSLGTFGVAYVARPVGGLIAGYVGDRFGRRDMMIGTLLVMGIATFLIGCLPEYRTIGIAAPIMLIALRLLQGVSVGGELSGSVSLTVEHAPERKRACYASWQTSGIWVGYILASMVFVAVSTMPSGQLLSWGWRIPFWSSAVIVVIGLLIRRTVVDPEVFVEHKNAGTHARLPLKQLFVMQGRDVVRVILIALVICNANIVMIFGLAYATSSVKVPGSVMLWVLIAGYAGCLITQPLAAIASDRIGRRPVLISACLLCAGVVWFYFWTISTGNVGLIVVGMALALSVAYGPVNVVHPVFFAEMFHVRYRVTGMALGLQLGAVISGFAPSIAQAMAGPDGARWWPACVFAMVVCLIAAVTVLFSRETFRTPLDQLGA